MQGQKGIEHVPSTQIIIAALDEEEGIGLTISELNKNLQYPHVLVVDGNSTDRTVEVAKNMGADIVFQDGHGKGDALAKALEFLTQSITLFLLTRIIPILPNMSRK